MQPSFDSHRKMCIARPTACMLLITSDG